MACGHDIQAQDTGPGHMDFSARIADLNEAGPKGLVLSSAPWCFHWIGGSRIRVKTHIINNGKTEAEVGWFPLRAMPSWVSGL